MSSSRVAFADQALRNGLLQFGLPSEVAEELLKHHTVLNYARGSIVFLQGAPADVVYWIRSGLVGLYAPIEDGGRLLVRLAGPGDIIGHVDACDTQGRRRQAFEAHARSNCQINLVTREHLYQVVRTLDGETLLRLIEKLNTLCSAEMSRWAHFLGLNFRRRLELVLRDLATRCGVREARGILIIPKLSHLDLAEMIGSSRPMVSRLVAEMTAQGFLSQHGKRYIVNGNFGAGNSNARVDSPVMQAAQRLNNGRREAHDPSRSSDASALPVRYKNQAQNHRAS